MAGEWIKFELATADKPEVLRMARILGIDKDSVVGKLVRLWAWFDKNSVDGVVDGVVVEDIDAICYQNGFANTLVSVNWLTVCSEGDRLSIPNFDRHNGESAKKRALKNERQARWRANVDADVGDKSATKASTKASTREEKRRDIKTTSPKGDFSAGFQHFWEAWPASDRKVAKAKCAECWKRFGLDSMADAVVAHVVVMRQSEQWQKGFEPAPLTYLNQRRWQDASETPLKQREVFT